MLFKFTQTAILQCLRMDIHSTFVICFSLSLSTLSLLSPRWPKTPDPPVLNSQVLDLQASVTTPSFIQFGD